MNDFLMQATVLLFVAFVFAFALLSVWSVSFWLASALFSLLNGRRKPDEHQPRKKKRTCLLPPDEVQPKYVVWGRRETRKRVTPWEPYYVGDDPAMLISVARERYPAHKYGLILLQNDHDPAEQRA